MKKISKSFSIILTLIMIISIIPMSSIPSNAATYSGECGDNLTWTYDTLTYTLTISGTGAMYDYDYNNRPWEIHDHSIKEIIINYGVTTIGKDAFADCKNVVTATIPSSVTRIGDYAFADCNSITNIIIPDSVTSIGNEAFRYCTSLINVKIGNSVITIGDYAFYYCDNLTSITIPDSVTTIGEYGFAFCWGLTSITIPGGVTKIADCAFFECSRLTSIIICDGVTNIGNSSFSYCTNLTSLTIPNSVKTIECGAFEYCDRLRDIFYLGTKEEWSKISIKGTYNYPLYNATIHFMECSHNYNSVVTLPTCTEQGYTTYNCECGYSYVGDYVNATGHTLTWHTLSVVSCQTDGVKHGYCNDCSYFEVETTPSTGHVYNLAITPPTCTQNGYTTYACDCGDSYIKNMIPSTGHEDTDVDAHCDNCDELLCNHDCHRGGITGLFWKIINFFNRIFGSNKTCQCGVAHY